MPVVVRAVGVVCLLALVALAAAGQRRGHKKPSTRKFKQSHVSVINGGGGKSPLLGDMLADDFNTPRSVADVQRLEQERVAREWEEGMFSPYQERLLGAEFSRLEREGGPDLTREDVTKLHQMNPTAVEQCARGNIKSCASLTSARDQIRPPAEGASTSAAYFGLEHDMNRFLLPRHVRQQHKDRWEATMRSDLSRFEAVMTPGLPALARSTARWKGGMPSLGHPTTTVAALENRLRLYDQLRADHAHGGGGGSGGAARHAGRSEGSLKIGDGAVAVTDDDDNDAIAMGGGAEEGKLAQGGAADHTDRVGLMAELSIDAVVKRMRQSDRLRAQQQQRNGADDDGGAGDDDDDDGNDAGDEGDDGYDGHHGDGHDDEAWQLAGCKAIARLAAYEHAPAREDQRPNFHFHPSAVEGRPVAPVEPALLHDGLSVVLRAMASYNGTCDSALRPPATLRTRRRQQPAPTPPVSPNSRCPGALVHAACLGAMSSLSRRGPEHARYIAQQGGYDAVITSLGANQAAAAVQAAGMHALGELSVSRALDPQATSTAYDTDAHGQRVHQSTAASVAARGVLKYAMLALIRHAESALVTEEACWLLGSLSTDRLVAKAVYQSGVLELVSRGLGAHLAVASAQDKCIWALHTLASNGVSYSREVASKNVHGIEAAVAAMTTHPTSASVQENGAWLLGILGGHDVWRGWGTRYAAHVGHLPMVTHWMTKARAFEAIGQAMLLHPGERLVQSACCQALRMLCTYSPYNKAAVVHTGALESVLVALEMHPDDQEQQSFGMWALVALLTNMPVCSSPVDCKVTSWVSPLGVPSADFSTDWDVRKRVIGAGGIDMAIAAMVAHPSAVEVQISGAACLTTLAHADAEAKAEITGRGGIQVLVAAMERAAQGSSRFEVEVAVCAALSTLAAGEAATKTLLAEGGAIEQIIAVMQQFAQPKVHAECAGAIANIVAGSTALSERALEAGAMEILVESLNANAEWAQVQANGCIALRNLGRDEAYKGQALPDGTVVPSCMADFWGTLRHSFTWYGWSLRFCTTAVVMWLGYELLALLERTWWPDASTFNVIYESTSDVVRRKVGKSKKTKAKGTTG